jgi:hypothetical protein
MPRSDPWVRLQAAQRQVNVFFWSSEFAYELVCREILTDELHARSPNSVNTIFASVGCHAFKPPAKAKRAWAVGQSPKHRTKYDATTREFETHLRNNLEQICRHVIVRFYGALEIYLLERARPFLHLTGMTKKNKKAEINKFQRTSFLNTERYLVDKNAPFRIPIARDIAVLAQACRMLRNDLVHEEAHWRWPWDDMLFRQSIEGMTDFDTDERSLIINYLCEGAKRKSEKDKQIDIPILFFYALFSFTHLHNFAEALENALPV